MWIFIESIIVLVAIGVAAALLACRAQKSLSGEDGCGCGKKNSCAAGALDSLSSGDSDDQDDEA